MRQYLLQVICAAFISGLVQCLVQGGAAKAVVKLLCGIFLTLTIVLPLTRMEVEELTLPSLREGEGLAAEGENLAREARARIIKQQCESYILDKAASLCDGLQVEITLRDDTQVPAGATLTGRVSPYAKGQIQLFLQQDLGIPKENVEWTG